MQEIRQELDRRWGKGEKLLFGEPWSAAGTAVRPGTRLAGKESLKRLDRETGAFCDATRDAVKGPIEVGRETEPGFVNGGGLDTGILTHCVRGWAGAEGPFSVKAPSQTITYLSSHDDWTLWDKLVLTMDPRRQYDRLDPAILQANRLAAAICFTCQGRLFLLYSVRQEAVLLPLPEGKWELLADGESSFRWQSPEVYSGTAPLAPMTAAIFGQRVEGVQVRRQCAVEYGANTAAVAYTIENRSPLPCTLRVRPFTPDAARTVREQLEPVEAMLREGCVGQIPEIYDGGTPDPSKGCFAQAWSVGELLRVYEQLENIEKEADSHAG